MKNAVRKIMSVVIVAAMFLCSTPLAGLVGLELPNINLFSLKAKAESATSGTCGENLTWVFDESTGTLTISGYGSMKKYDNQTFDDRPWSTLLSDIINVIIEDGVTSISAGSFYDCTNLTNIKIPDSITTIGAAAFGYCESLTSITIPDSVSNIDIFTFYYCTSLTNIAIPNSITTIGANAFGYCERLTNIIIPDKVTLIDYGTFTGCKNLTNIIIPNNVTSIGDHAFDYCENLTSVTIGNSVSSIGDYAFRCCYLLTSITIPEGVKSIGVSAFEYCPKLANVIIPDSVTSIANKAFYYSFVMEYIHIPSSVTEIGDQIVVPDSVKAENIEDIKSTLENLTEEELKEYAMEGITKENVANWKPTTAICSDTEDCYAKEYAEANGYSFQLCNGHNGEDEKPKSGTCGENLTWSFDEATGTLTISGTGEMTNWENTEDVPWYLHSTNVKTVNVGDGVTSIGDFAFAFCDNLVNVLLPEGLTVIGKGSFGCSGIESITLPDSLISIGESAFYECVNLKSINIPKSLAYLGNEAFYNSGLESMEYNAVNLLIDPNNQFAPFNTCTNLTEINFGKDVKSIPDFCFWGIEAENIVIPDGVESIGQCAFSHCSKLSNISIPDSVTYIGNHAFVSCESLKEIVLPQNLTAINNNTFMYCINLESVVLNNNLTTIKNNAFYQCTSLKSINIPQNIITIEEKAFEFSGIETINFNAENLINDNQYSPFTYTYLTKVNICKNVKSIPSFMFSECNSLQSITVSKNVNSIGNNAFYYCNQLKDVYFYGTEEEWNIITIGEDNEPLLNATIHFIDAPEHTHSYSSTVTKDASCAETGIMTYTCECGDSYTEEIAKISHSDGEWETVVEATCTTQGKKVKKCAVCGTITANEIIPVITHSDNNSDGFCDICDRITDEDLINGIYIAISPVEEHIINYMESVTLTATTANLPEGYTVKWVAEGEGVTIKAYGNKCKVTSTSTGRVVIKAYVVDAKGRVVTDENGKPVCDSEYFHSDANFWLRIIYFFKQLFKFY